MSNQVKETPKLLTVRIQSPEGLIWEGKAESLTSKNSRGVFDILPYHARFITVIEDSPIVINLGKEEKRFSAKVSVLSVDNDTISIFTGL